MKIATGIVRSIDHLGRFVIPKEMRRHLQIAEGDLLEGSLEGDRIVITKYARSCIMCSSTENLLTFRDKQICRVCLEQMKEEL